MGEPLLPLIVRFGIRLLKLFAGWFIIGLAGAMAKDLLGLSDVTRASYVGGFNMLLVLWFMGLLSDDQSASPPKGDEGR